MNNKLQFNILKKLGKARVWEIELNWVKLKTPVFMPVGTKATIKGMVLNLLLDPKNLGTKEPIQLILANTYHLFLAPWEKTIKKAWWLHKFENRPNLILTDSWGFQVFSLWLGKDTKTKKGDSLVKLQPDGVWFKSPKDGKKHFFNPEWVVDIQCDLGSDIMMMLDVCSPTENISKAEVESHMRITHKWAKQAFEYYETKYDENRGVLFPIVQWWLYNDLRQESVEYLSWFAKDGIAIGGLSVGETKDEMYTVLDFLSDKLPEDKPRYLMWVGTPEDIRQAIYEGIDMFDCVLPTRLGRHGTAFGQEGYVKLKNAQYKEDYSPIDSKCNCYVCKNYTKSYLHHLIKEKEMLGGILISLHNIAYLHQLVEQIREEIMNS